MWRHRHDPGRMMLTILLSKNLSRSATVILVDGCHDRHQPGFFAPIIIFKKPVRRRGRRSNMRQRQTKNFPHYESVKRVARVATVCACNVCVRDNVYNAGLLVNLPDLTNVELTLYEERQHWFFALKQRLNSSSTIPRPFPVK